MLIVCNSPCFNADSGVLNRFNVLFKTGYFKVRPTRRYMFQDFGVLKRFETVLLI
jgi:hypothetical protein